MTNKKIWVSAAALLMASSSACSSPSPSAEPPSAAPAVAHCTLMTQQNGPTAVQPTSVSTIEDAYWCLFANYFAGPSLDDRQLLVAGFGALAAELMRRGLDRPNAALPALSGDRAADWSAFRTRYEQVTGTLPADVRESLALTTIKAMADSLHDDHTHVDSMTADGGGQQGRFDLGLHTEPTGGPAPRGGPEQTPPLYIDDVFAGTPAAKAGLRPGDVIVAVNGLPPYVNDVLSPGVVALLYPPPSRPGPVKITFRRPATGKTGTIAVTPGWYDAGTEPKVDAKVVNGNLALVSLPGFFSGAADQLRQALSGLSVKGLILDLRANRGGDPAEVGKLLSAFVHDKPYLRLCDSEWKCTVSRTDSTTPLLGLPLVVLTGRQCGSACDNFAAGIKDYRLGKLVGTRTAGIASGPADDYLLGDGKTVLGMPKLRALGPVGELLGGVGVPPDEFLPTTPADLSAGRDPALDRARSLLA